MCACYHWTRQKTYLLLSWKKWLGGFHHDHKKTFKMMRCLPKHTAKCWHNLVFFCSPLTHHYKLSGQPWFSRSQGSFLTKLTSSEAKMSLMVQQLFIPSPAALGIKMELVKSFLIGSSQVGTPLQRRWRRVNFQGMCPQMKKETWSLKTEAMLALPWLPDFSKLHKVKQCQLEVNQIPA